MEALSQKQQRILEIISTHIAAHDRPPTNREIGQAIGIASTGHVDYHLSMLAKKGFLEREANTSRGLRLTVVAEPRPKKRVFQVRVEGLIAAGEPLEAITDPNDAIELSDDFAAQDAYALRVRGTSMIEDLIGDGDLVVVKPTESAENGDLVVALLTNGASEHGEATLKRYYREGDNRVRLQPGNSAMAPLYVRAEDVRVQGRVIAVIRRI